MIAKCFDVHNKIHEAKHDSFTCLVLSQGTLWEKQRELCANVKPLTREKVTE